MGFSKYLIPAVGVNMILQTDMGSPAFRQGLLPTASLLFDHTLPFDIGPTSSTSWASSTSSRRACRTSRS